MAEFSLRAILALLLLGFFYQANASNTTTTTTTPPDNKPQLCAPHAHAYYQPPLLGPASSSPLALGRGALRRYHWNCKLRAGEPGRAVSVDDAHDGLTPDTPARWRPWTHKPQCGRTTNFCVYTQAALTSTGVGRAISEPQGISILTTPEMAASALHPHAFALQPGALALYEGWVATALNGTATGTAYAVQPVPGKGQGAVATTAIPPGTPVVVDRPVLLAHVKKTAQETDIDFAASVDDYGLAPEAFATRVRLWTAAVDQLPPDTAAFVRHNLTVLARLTRPDNEAIAHTGNTTVRAIRLPREEKVFSSNAMQVVVDGYPMMALFPKVAVFNHDCRPNLIAHFNEKTLTMALWSTRAIAPGEELTINYLPDLLPTDTRRDLLHRRWGFTCRCTLCTTADPEAQHVSDTRRAAALRLLDRVPHALHAGDPHGALHAAQALHDAYVAEGVITLAPRATRPYVSLAGFAPDAALADPFGPEAFAATLGGLYAAAGESQQALPWLRAAREELEWRSGGWPTEAQQQRMVELEMVLEEMEGKKWWWW